MSAQYTEGQIVGVTVAEDGPNPSGWLYVKVGYVERAYIHTSALSPLPAGGLGPVTDDEWREWASWWGDRRVIVDGVLAARAAQQPGVDAEGLGRKLSQAYCDAADRGELAPDCWTAVARAAMRECGRMEAKVEPATVLNDAEPAGDLARRCGDDASKWAAEFRAIALRLGYSDMDEGWLIGWFANAIEHSSDVRRWRREAAERARATGYCERLGDKGAQPAGEYEEARVATGPRGNEPDRPYPNPNIVRHEGYDELLASQGDAPDRPAQIAEANTRVADRAEGAEQAVRAYRAKASDENALAQEVAKDQLREALDVRRAILTPPPAPDAVGELVAAVQQLHDDTGGYDNHAMRRVRAAIAAVEAQKKEISK